MSLDTIPAIYCGTYHKYNCGSIFGKWFKLNEFADCDEFLDACRELHSDEEDPELIPYKEIEEEDDTPFSARFLSK